LDARIIAAIISAITLIIITIYEIKKKEKNDKETVNIEDNILPLKKHPVFSRIDYLLGRIDYIAEESTVRKELSKDIIIYYLMTVKTGLHCFIKEIEELENSKEETYSFHEIHMKYLNKMLKDFKNLDNYPLYLDNKNKKSVKIYIKKFNKINEKNIQYIIERSLNIADNVYFDNHKIKTAVLLDVYMSMLNNFLESELKTLYLLDGELDNKFYKDKKIEKIYTYESDVPNFEGSEGE